ncbi:MAG: hypothetical protein HOL13_09005 [Phycisphaerae bacterium]|jgi:uncharacterized membrane protein|nr:hypothetical protein [Phycisphaerae bacterium]MBT5657046.1 hypothetical protein [Phycisphaerae bacterium]
MMSCALIGLTTSTAVLGAPQFEIVDIGTFGTGPCGAYDVSESNTACGMGTAPNGLNQHAFYWDGEIMHNIPPLNAPAGGHSWGFAMNSHGHVVGYANAASGSAFHPYKWTQEDGSIDLGVPTWSAGNYGQAKDINDSGTVAGLVGTVPYNIRGCIWINGEMLQVPTFGGDESQCLALNELNDVVGFSRLESGQMRGFVVPTGNVDNIIELEAPEGGGAQATDINEQRVICGWGLNEDSTFHALKWSIEGGMEFLGEPAGWETFAYDINESGWIVGRAIAPLSLLGAGTEHACAWIDGEFVLLEDLVINNADGAEFRFAHGVNESGWIATSLAWDAQDNRAAVLRPVEPMTGDANGDGVVNTDDVLLVISSWGPCELPCDGDLNGDGFIDTDDLLAVLSGWSN